jgi:hypothetical protein
MHPKGINEAEQLEGIIQYVYVVNCARKAPPSLLLHNTHGISTNLKVLAKGISQNRAVGGAKSMGWAP